MDPVMTTLRELWANRGGKREIIAIDADGRRFVMVGIAPRGDAIGWDLTSGHDELRSPDQAIWRKWTSSDERVPWFRAVEMFDRRRAVYFESARWYRNKDDIVKDYPTAYVVRWVEDMKPAIPEPAMHERPF